MYACLSLFDKVVKDHDYFMFIFVYVYMYVCMSLYDRVIRDHSCGGIIAYVVE